MIEAVALGKTYRKTRAVHDVSFTARPGRVTGFLGLNGSGKTTTLRMLVGLTRPTAGTALIGGRPFTELTQPARQVGAVLDQGISHPGQSGRAHLVTHAILAGAPRTRVDALLEQVGLSEAGQTRTGDYSLGMRQRLAVATALLGEPPVLILDEPANGLDPEGIAWLRGLLRAHADAGGTVLISSHYQHRTAALVYLARPKRLQVLVAQVLAAVAVSWLLTFVSGIAVQLRGGHPHTWAHTLTVVPVMAVFGAALAAVVRRSSWLLLGFAFWFVLVEGLAGQLRWPLPISSYLQAAEGDAFGLEVFVAWAVVALAVAVPMLARDLSGD